MYLAHLSLTHYRNYQQLELDFTEPITLFQGQNAQGKTNLLEAIYFLSTTKPVHAQQEREIVDWQAQSEPIPYSRIAAEVHSDGRPLHLEIILSARGDGVNFTKQIKLNGVSKRSMDLLGVMPSVLFLPADIRLVDGGPGERRRYLDIALCQIDRVYCRALSDFQKVLNQRNSLLRTLRDQAIRPDRESIEAQLGFWDEKLVQHGSLVMSRRHNFVLALERSARERHAALSDTREELALYYTPSFNPGHLTELEFTQLRDSQLLHGLGTTVRTPLTPEQVAEQYKAKLQSRRAREVTAGNTLYGPHRDDLRIVANDRDLRTYGSRGQQRTAALALKLAELHLSTQATGTAPILLLDDVMSELDLQRRNTLLQALTGVEQAIVTTTDWSDFAPDFRRQAALFHVHAGQIQPIAAEPGTAEDQIFR
ncbi:MAG: DNA replication/repair protein RecF [Caldilineaceae bacterium]|nr:DNA replication/repair protein RecF [Caldilineaceae bacterium]